MMVINGILFALNIVLVPIAFIFGWIRAHEVANKRDMELYDAYAKLGKSVYDNLIKEDDHE